MSSLDREGLNVWGVVCEDMGHLGRWGGGGRKSSLLCVGQYGQKWRVGCGFDGWELGLNQGMVVVVWTAYQYHTLSSAKLGSFPIVMLFARCHQLSYVQQKCHHTTQGGVSILPACL